jgi:hypothetical protein
VIVVTGAEMGAWRLAMCPMRSHCSGTTTDSQPEHNGDWHPSKSHRCCPYLRLIVDVAIGGGNDRSTVTKA